jgi:adenosyl cobinamide kinase/adenosyl cobinamide phosphate guanylyltransferase
MLTVLLGGARSGKSSAALRIAERSVGEVCFVATSPRIAGDDDLNRRIDAHRAERPTGWRTIEAELDLAAAITEAGEAHAVVDCLTVWLGNLLHHGRSDDEIFAASSTALAAATARTADTTVVTNEVGLGIVPADAMTRRYRDLLGHINQHWVAASDRALLLVAGRVLPLTDLGAS